MPPEMRWGKFEMLLPVGARQQDIADTKVDRHKTSSYVGHTILIIRSPIFTSDACLSSKYTESTLTS